MKKDEQILAVSRMIILLIIFLNSILAHYGKPVIKTDNEFVYQTVSDFILLANIFYVWWKNNNITKNAVKAQNFKNTLDERKK